jgi:hypothetical protein
MYPAATLMRTRSDYASPITHAAKQNAAPPDVPRLHRALSLVSSTRGNDQGKSKNAEEKANEHTSQDQPDGHEAPPAHGGLLIGSPYPASRSPIISNRYRFRLRAEGRCGGVLAQRSSGASGA